MSTRTPWLVTSMINRLPRNILMPMMSYPISSASVAIGRLFHITITAYRGVNWVLPSANVEVSGGIDRRVRLLMVSDVNPRNPSNPVSIVTWKCPNPASAPNICRSMFASSGATFGGFKIGS